ncbi:hypothetical protein QQP08_020223 [Theobroma cacao]|nr:hypothetical protein QQP08_020223 [Theobroma cacao]
MHTKLVNVVERDQAQRLDESAISSYQTDMATRPTGLVYGCLDRLFNASQEIMENMPRLCFSLDELSRELVENTINDIWGKKKAGREDVSNADVDFVDNGRAPIMLTDERHSNDSDQLTKSRATLCRVVVTKWRGKKAIKKGVRNCKNKFEISIKLVSDSDIARRNEAIIKEVEETLYIGTRVDLEFDLCDEEMGKVFVK